MWFAIAVGVVFAFYGSDMSEAWGVGFPHVRSVGAPVDVQAVVRDQPGFVWTAGAQGVCRFDGLEWLCPVEASARAASVDAQGLLWAGLADGTIVRINPRGWSAERQKSVSGVIASLLKVNDTLWVATSTGLYRKQGVADWTALLKQPSMALLARADGAVVVAVQNRLLSFGKDGVQVVLATFDADITAAGATRTADEWLVGLKNGHVVRVTKHSQQRLPFSPNLTGIHAVAEDAMGTVWTGSHGGVWGLERASKKLMELAVAHGLPHYQANAIALGDDDSLWVGTRAGLTHVRVNHPLRNLDVSGSAADITFAVTGNAAGDIFTSTVKGLSIWNGQGVQDARRAARASDFDSRSLAVDDAGALWVSGSNSGLYSLQQGTVVRRWPTDPSLYTGVRSLRPRSAGGLWVGLNDGGLARFAHDEFTLEFSPRAKRADRVFDMLEQPHGQGLLLALSHDGLAAWHDGTLRRYTAADGLPPQEILCLHNGLHGDVWIGSHGGGLLRLKQGKLTALTVDHGLIDNHIFGLVDDGLGRLWMSSRLGIAGVDFNQLTEAAEGRRDRVQSVEYRIGDGIEGEPVRAFPPSAYRARDGILWFPTIRGLVSIDPRAVRPATEYGQLVLDDVQVNGKSAIAPQHKPPAASRSALLFRFAIPSFAPAHRLRVRYKLEGLEGGHDTWHESQSAREARYQSVSPGRYRFVVQAFSSSDPSKEQVREVSFALHLPQPWQDRLEVRVAALLLFFLLLGLIHRTRLRHLERMHTAVLFERSRIARDIHDSLEQDLAGLRLQVDAAALALANNAHRAADHLQRASELISDGVADLRNSIWGLRASSVTTSELVTAVRTRLERITAGTAVTVQVAAEGEPHMLPASVATQVVNVAREAVTNALKHAEASHINVTLNTSDDELVLQVADNGRGLAAEPSPSQKRLGGGLGLPSMQARAEALGGRLAVEPGAESGVVVRLYVPKKKLKKPLG